MTTQAEHQSGHPLDGSPIDSDRAPLYSPHVLREYSVLADGERGALIGPHGDIVWMCAPRWDCDAVFSSLIGGGGVYAVTPQDRRHVWGGYYEPDTLIWRSRWTTTTGVIECREALAFPGDPARVVLLRRILAHDQPAAVRILLRPAAGFGHEPAGELTQSEGVWSGRTRDLHWRWHGGEHAPPARSPRPTGSYWSSS